MDWPVLITAVGLLFVFEGMWPFLSPLRWRRVMQQVALMSEAKLRLFGLLSMLVGLLLVSIARDLY